LQGVECRVVGCRVWSVGWWVAGCRVQCVVSAYTEALQMCSGSEEGSYLRLIDFVYHSTLGLRVIKKKRR